MGQYYLPLIMSENGGRVIAAFSSFDFDNGMKLTEHSYYGNLLVDSFLAYAAGVGESTIAWVGDYAEMEEDILPLEAHAATNPANDKGRVHRDFPRMLQKAQHVWNNGKHRVKKEDIPQDRMDSVDKLVAYDFRTRQRLDLGEYRRLVIAARKEAEKLPPCVDPDDIEGFVLHPIPLLTCVGNGKGGGDYRGDSMEWVGAWAFHPIALLPKGTVPDDGEWEDITGKFRFEEGRYW